MGRPIKGSGTASPSWQRSHCFIEEIGMMMPYLIFLSVLLLTIAIIFVAVRLFKAPLRFESIFIPLVTVIFFLPFVCLSLLIWIVISTGLLLVSAEVLSAFGMLNISGWPTWRITRVWNGLLLTWILLAGAFYVAKFRGDLFRFFARQDDVRPSRRPSEGRSPVSNVSEGPIEQDVKERD
jgi:hypothetical protein